MVTLKFRKLFNGFQWEYTSTTGHSLSVILHDSSYGHESGLFETMSSWDTGIKGHLTHKQVARKIDTLYKLDR